MVFGGKKTRSSSIAAPWVSKMKIEDDLNFIEFPCCSLGFKFFEILSFSNRKNCQFGFQVSYICDFWNQFS